MALFDLQFTDAEWEAMAESVRQKITAWRTAGAFVAEAEVLSAMVTAHEAELFEEWSRRMNGVRIEFGPGVWDALASAYLGMMTNAIVNQARGLQTVATLTGEAMTKEGDRS